MNSISTYLTKVISYWYWLHPKEILVVTFGTIGEFLFNKLVEVVRGEFIMEGLDNNEELL